MTNQSILEHIRALIAEEQDMYGSDDLPQDHHARLESIQVELDQCWDLLRQRRAKQEFGEDPDQAAVRPPDVVENYEQ